MLFIKYILWLVIYLLLFIIFSFNTLISIFAFILLVLVLVCFLLMLHIEYLAYVIMLLYLGGVLIFFLFVTLLLQNETHRNKESTSFSIEGGCLFVIFFKFFIFILYINEQITKYIADIQLNYYPTHLSNEVFYTNYLEEQGDISALVSLYTHKYPLIILIGLLLFFIMIGVVVIVKKRNE